LKANQFEGAPQRLDERIAECEAAQILRESDPWPANFEEVRALVQITRTLWAVYPFKLQFRLCFARVEPLLKTVSATAAKFPGASVKDWPQDGKEAMDDFFDCVSIIPSEDSNLVSTLHTFDGGSITFGNSLANLLAKLDVKEDVALSQSSQPAAHDEFSMDITAIVAVKEQDQEPEPQNPEVRDALEDTVCFVAFLCCLIFVLVFHFASHHSLLTTPITINLTLNPSAQPHSSVASLDIVSRSVDSVVGISH
jgi:hypothetical protein